MTNIEASVMADEATTLGVDQMAGDSYTSPAGIIPSEFRLDDDLRRILPPIDPSAREELERSLKEQGCRDPLVKCKIDGEYVLLDGYNRYEICEELGIQYETIEIAISDLTAAKIWRIENQTSRRNLNESQRGMMAVKLESLYSKAAKDRQGVRTDLGASLDVNEVGRSAVKAANLMGVSHQTVFSAKKVKSKGIPELAALVECGKIAVSPAVKVTALPHDLQKKVVEKVEEKASDGKRANIARIIYEVVPRTPEIDARARFDKSKKNLASSLKLLKGVETTYSRDKLKEIQDLVDRISLRLKEIGEKSPDPFDPNTQETPQTSNDQNSWVYDAVRKIRTRRLASKGSGENASPCDANEDDPANDDKEENDNDSKDGGPRSDGNLFDDSHGYYDDVEKGYGQRDE